MAQIKSADSVKANSLFDGINKNFFFNINQKDFVEKKEGEVIYQSGEPSEYIYLILDGEIKIKIPGVFRSPVIIKNGKNEFFGEQEFLENIKRNTSAVANTDCVLYRIDKETLNVLIYNNKKIKGNLHKFSDVDVKTDEEKKAEKYFKKTAKDVNDVPVDEPKPLKMNTENNISEELKNFRLEEAEKDLKKVEEFLEDNEQELKWDFQSESPQDEIKKTKTNFLSPEEIPKVEVESEIPKTSEAPLQAINNDEMQISQKDLSTEKLIFLKPLTSFINENLKYPLSTIKFYAEQIKKRDNSKEVTDVVDLLIEQAEIISNVLKTTNDFAEAKSVLNIQTVSISAVLDEILVILADYIESFNAKLYKKYETMALVNIDKQQFFQAVFQITKNACEAMPAGGNIYFITKIESGFVRIEIKNNGEIIPEVLHDKIFEPFFSSKENSAGIGLSIAEKIIKDHGGEISINPESDETSFIIIIPLAE